MSKKPQQIKRVRDPMFERITWKVYARLMIGSDWTWLHVDVPSREVGVAAARAFSESLHLTDVALEREVHMVEHVVEREDVLRSPENIGGKEISRHEALKGLGNPKTWKKEAAALDRKFKKKPKGRRGVAR